MIVEGRDYRFTMFQARESSLVAERAAFLVKMLQEGVSEHKLAFRLYAIKGVATELVPLNLLPLY